MKQLKKKFEILFKYYWHWS